MVFASISEYKHGIPVITGIGQSRYDDEEATNSLMLPITFGVAAFCLILVGIILGWMWGSRRSKRRRAAVAEKRKNSKVPANQTEKGNDLWVAPSDERYVMQSFGPRTQQNEDDLLSLASGFSEDENQDYNEDPMYVNPNPDAMYMYMDPKPMHNTTNPKYNTYQNRYSVAKYQNVSGMKGMPQEQIYCNTIGHTALNIPPDVPPNAMNYL